jgi:hypothetical protein
MYHRPIVVADDGPMMFCEPALLASCKTMMFETLPVNQALAVHIPVDMMERRLAAARSLTTHL